MRLTCCCGASIFIDYEPASDVKSYDKERYERVTALREFKEDHAPCIEKYLATPPCIRPKPTLYLFRRNLYEEAALKELFLGMHPDDLRAFFRSATSDELDVYATVVLGYPIKGTT